MTLLDAFTFFGHLHPLIVHLPVGFLLLAFIFHAASRFKNYRHLEQAVSFSLLVGFISAVLSCIFGYLLSLTGDYDRIILKHHKAAGIWLAILSGVLYLLATRRFLFFPRTMFSIAFVLLAVLMAYTGHEGGVLTHGSDYLTLRTLTRQKRPKPVSLDDTYLYEDVVHPLLESRCGQCHEGARLKGGLSIETLEDILKGGKDGPVIVAGKPLESELYRRITLDPGQEKFMPTDGKTPLKKHEIEIIRWWLEKAGAAEGEKLLAIKNNESIRPNVARYLGMGTEDGSGAEDGITQHINRAIPATLDTVAVERLRSKGWMVRWMLHSPAMLDISLPTYANTQIGDARKDLETLARNIVWLNISGRHATDQDLSFLNKLSNLEKLRLEKNPVTDAICVPLSTLGHLQAVNLNETNVTESGLSVLRKNLSLKKIYNWKPPG